MYELTETCMHEHAFKLQKLTNIQLSLIFKLRTVYRVISTLCYFRPSAFANGFAPS